jgi:glycosyltransferase involved in cell wall biosynthesis
VWFVPFIHSREELNELIRGATFFVFPSTVEGMSLMLLEVASLGTALVCSDIAENVAVLQDHAMYFRSGDVEDLAEKLRWALSHQDEMQELAIRAQAHMRAHFAWDHIVDQYEALYQRAVGNVRIGYTPD